MNNKKLFKKNDLILIGIILAVVIVGLVVMKFVSSGSGDIVLVTVDGEEYARLPLDKDTELLITDAVGGTNLLVIKDSVAYISEASCKNQVCVNTGKISQVGELIVCLPNKVVVTIESSESQ